MDAQDVLSQLESDGMTIKDIQELSGVGLGTLYDIKSGRRSGKTSLPALRRLLEASQSYISLAMPNNVIDSSIVAIDEKPYTPPVRPSKPQHVPTQRALQPQPPQNYGLSQQEQDARALAYRQSRNRYNGVTPDALMQEIQGLRYEIHQLRQEQRQGQKQRVTQIQRGHADTSSDPMLDLIANGATLIKQIYDSRQMHQMHQTRQTEEKTVEPTRYVPTQALTVQYLQSPEPVQLAPSRTIGAYRNGPARPGMYGIHPHQARQAEPPPSTWQRFKNFVKGTNER